MELKIEYIDIDKIKPYEKNPRHNEEAIPFVMNSIKEFGFKVPIILDKNNVIIAGHTRVESAKRLGMKEVPCLYAKWDFNMLDAELSDLDLDMSDFGFDKLDINVDDYGTDFNLPDGEKSEMETMSFCLHKNQKLLIEEALELVKNEIHETFGNENKNGNAIYEVVRQWVEQKK